MHRRTPREQALWLSCRERLRINVSPERGDQCVGWPESPGAQPRWCSRLRGAGPRCDVHPRALLVVRVPSWPSLRATWRIQHHTLPTPRVTGTPSRRRVSRQRDYAKSLTRRFEAAASASLPVACTTASRLCIFLGSAYLRFLQLNATSPRCRCAARARRPPRAPRGARVPGPVSPGRDPPSPPPARAGRPLGGHH